MAISEFWSAAAAAVPTLGLAAAAIWKFYREWRAAHPSGESWQEREARSVERGRELLDRGTAAYLDRLERDVLRLEGECDDLRFDRDRGWNLARWWKNKADDQRHALVNALFAAGKFDPVPVLPGLEDPEPRPSGRIA
jgi:hypothetical protein